MTVQSLESQLNASESEKKRIQDEQRDIGRFSREAVLKYNEDETERLNKQVQRLKAMAEEQDETIEQLETTLRKVRVEKRRLEMQLAEKEIVIQHHEQVIKDMRPSINEPTVPHQETSPSQASSTPARRVKGIDLQGKDWLLSCSKGHKKSETTVAKEVWKSRRIMSKHKVP